MLILYPLVNTRAAPVGVREGTAQMVTSHVSIVVATDRSILALLAKHHSQLAVDVVDEHKFISNNFRSHDHTLNFARTL